MTNGTLRSVRIACSALIILAGVFAGSANAQTRRYGGGGITVFTNPNFGGQSATFREDVPDLRGYSLNDKISSIEITDGQSWEVCQDINFGNRCQVFSGSVSDLRQMGWNDRISSLRRVANGGFGARRNGGVFGNNTNNTAQRLVFYDRPNFRGNPITVTGNGNTTMGNRLAGSVEVLGGSWELCDRSGRCATVTQSVPDLSRLGLNGRITSARLVNGNQNNNGWYGNNRRRY
jgi:hypothetical protein